MTDENANESNAEGTETHTTVTEDKGTLNDVDGVRKNYEELKAVNDKMERELLRAEQLKAKQRQGGRANAGQEPPKEKEIDPVQYSKDALAGSVGDGKEE